MRALPGVVLAVTLAALGGCGEDKVNADEVEQGIEQDLSSATTEIRSVSCPDDVEKQKGATFECTAKLTDGGKATIVVEQTTAAGTYEYSYKPGSVQIADDSLEPEIEEGLEQQGVAGAQVDCPDLVKVSTDKSFTCSVVGAQGRQGALTFTFSDDAGTVDSSSIETEAG
jgi:hypothetical protein